MRLRGNVHLKIWVDWLELKDTEILYTKIDLLITQIAFLLIWYRKHRCLSFILFAFVNTYD